MFCVPPLEVFAKPSKGKIVDCVVFQGELIVATEHRLFRLVRDELVPIKFADEAEKED